MVSEIMRTFKYIFITITVACLASCLNDSEADKVEDITMYVSDETGFYYSLFDDNRENAIEGMLIREKGQSHWDCVAFDTVKDFTYQKGKSYVLKVRKTTLIDPPQDGSNIRYELIKIITTE